LSASSATWTANCYVNYLLQLTIHRLYLLAKLKQGGLDINSLPTIFRTIVVSRVTYALPAWYGQLSQWVMSSLPSVAYLYL